MSSKVNRCSARPQTASSARWKTNTSANTPDHGHVSGSTPPLDISPPIRQGWYPRNSLSTLPEGGQGFFVGGFGGGFTVGGFGGGFTVGGFFVGGLAGLTVFFDLFVGLGGSPAFATENRLGNPAIIEAPARIDVLFRNFRTSRRPRLGITFST